VEVRRDAGGGRQAVRPSKWRRDTAALAARRDGTRRAAASGAGGAVRASTVSGGEASAVDATLRAGGAVRASTASSDRCARVRGQAAWYWRLDLSFCDTSLHTLCFFLGLASSS
jgi:hypothetical protein